MYWSVGAEPLWGLEAAHLVRSQRDEVPVKLTTFLLF